jgi:hypothetical protein
MFRMDQAAATRNAITAVSALQFVISPAVKAGGPLASARGDADCSWTRIRRRSYEGGEPNRMGTGWLVPQKLKRSFRVIRERTFTGRS